MDLQNAMSVIESCAGFTDDSTPAGEAWSVVQAEIERLKTVVGKLTGARLESIRESRAILEGTRPQTVMDHKYVDGKCHEQGCQAFVLRDQINECRRLLREAVAACEVYLPVVLDDQRRVALLTLEWYEAARAARGSDAS